LFPAEYVKEFQACLDKTPPVPFEVIKGVIHKELGRPLEEVYDFVDPQPLASASVAQAWIFSTLLKIRLIAADCVNAKCLKVTLKVIYK
jgi:hypothetical protein